MTSFWNTTSAIRLETTSFCGFFTAHRKAENSIQRKVFKKLPAINRASTSHSASSGRSSSYRNLRLQARPHQYARLQLSGLWDTSPHLYVENAFSRLLDELYGHLPWYATARQRGDVDALIESITRFGKKAKEGWELSDLFSALSTQEAKIFYKMLVGTHVYTLENKTGCPPLLDFVSFSSINMKHTCCFSFASLPLLRALFDADTVSEILALEKKKWEKDHKMHTCTKQELLAMLQYRPHSPTQSQAIEKYFYFGTKATARDRIFGRDNASEIHVKRVLERLITFTKICYHQR